MALVGAHVVKIKYENTLRRVILNQLSEDELSFGRLENRIRTLFRLPATVQLVVTYTDTEGDVITMANDQDVVDALVQQALNPLRLYVTLLDPMSDPSPDSKTKVEKSTATDTTVDTRWKQLLDKQISVAPGLMENILQTIASQVRDTLKSHTDKALSGSFGSGVTGSSAPTPPNMVSPKDVMCTASKALNETATWTETPRFLPFKAICPAKAICPVSKTGSEKDSADAEVVVHQGVACDICSVSPIVGIRWKSNKKFDYDLCPSCFEKHGNVDEYTKIEQPLFRPRPFHGPQRIMRMSASSPVMGSFPPVGPHFHGGRPYGVRGPGRHHFCPVGGGAFGGKMDARFVCDVTMFDGTEVAPSAAFTKIWRLRNSGNLPWPVHTSLVHVGGDELGQVSTVPLELPEQGLAPEGELDVSVDLVAPAKPGRYVSNWRLASPVGPKFGHRIWVIIQVVTKEILEQQPAEAVAVDVEAKAADGGSTSAGAVDVTNEVEPAASFVNVEAPPASEYSGRAIETDTSVVEERALATVDSGELGGEFSMVDVAVEEKATEGDSIPAAVANDIAVRDGVRYVVRIAAPVEKIEEPITYPVLEDVPRDVGPITYPVVETAIANEAEQVEGELPTMKSLLAKLCSMGFTDSKLNEELLQRNYLDLRKTLNDLCSAEEWDPILEELEEMGFYDTEMNRRLMFKNNGSVKRVVKELVQMNRDLQGKIKKV